MCVNKKRPLLYAAIKGKFVRLKVSLLFLLFLGCPGCWEPPFPAASSAPALPAPGRFSWKAGQERGRAASDPAEASLSPSPSPLALLWVLPGQAGRRTPVPRGAARRTSGRLRREHLERPRRIPGGRSWRVLPPKPGAARADSETPEEGKEGGEGAAREGTAQVRTARRPRSRVREGPG